ncbi:inorganic phosphate transporter [Salipiger bermudensis]|nr:inorganic phosphate transporter [Salipiger bermudensis]
MYTARPLVGLGISLVFVTVAALSAALLMGGEPQTLAVVVAAAFGAYLALNIGANDVANNMGPAVGARALPLGLAIAIAAICESAGAILAGGDVIDTVSTGIFDPSGLQDPEAFVPAMMATLLAASLWVNLATWIGAPVSTTHSMIGAVVGAALAAGGLLGPVNWMTLLAIVTTWVATPVVGGLFAAAGLAFIEWRILRVPDKLSAARRWVPLLIGVMAAAFTTYLAIKGLNRVLEIALPAALGLGAVVGCLVTAISVPLVRRSAAGMENRNRSIKQLFSLPLIAAAALLSFAHGANDVANAVGPLAALVQVQHDAQVSGSFALPLWIMLIGAFGISVGLVLFGPKLIGMVGNQITKLNPMRAYCVALSTAVTVIAASWAGLPVSTTHIAIGGVFGVGFFREWETEWRFRRQRSARQAAAATATAMPRQERRRRRLVRRSHFLTILGAWAITVPAAAILSAICYTLLELLAF